MPMITVSAAYARNYERQAEILADWIANKDFIIRTLGPDYGRYVNRADAMDHIVVVRYAKDRKAIVLAQPKPGAEWRIT